MASPKVAVPKPTIVIKGIEELMQKLHQFEPKIQKKLLRSTLRKAAKPVLATARRFVPVDTGALRKSIKIKALKRSRKNKYTVGVRVITSDDNLFVGDQYYGGFIEFGHRVGKRSRTIKRLQTKGKIGRAIAERIDRREKVEARPFMRPAHDLNKFTVKQIFEQELRSAINDAAK